MTREDIKQLVFDRIGVILVDKAEIHENSSFEDLKLDEDDVDELFNYLESQLEFTLPAFVRERAKKAPDHMTPNFLVDFILTMRDDRRTKEDSYVKKGKQDRHRRGRPE